ncbi:MAG TPA: hypothetical protein VMS73_02465 [Anaerolineaceae bacterium]|nr:hypothetical protein [Anaerolineaceae bacterium]
MKIHRKNPGQPVVALFDLDGVLIRPGGYRAAVEASINYFSERMGLGKQAPAEEDVALMEACGITSEWDMVPIFLAIMLENISKLQSNALPDCSLLDLIPKIAEKDIHLERSYRQAILELAQYLNPSISPAEAILLAIENGKLMDSLKGKTFGRDLLGQTRSIAASLSTRVFQTYILGDEGFSANYGMAPDFQSESLLSKNDRCLLNPEDRKLIQHLIDQKVIRASVITARPSLPPAFGKDGKNVYSPEGEMALKLTGLEDISLIGYGTIQYLAGRTGVSPDSLLKPSPVQALAAIASAFSRDERNALSWSAAIVGLEPLDERLVDLPSSFKIHIFEDSPIGILSSQSAAALLNRKNFNVAVNAWGISTNQDKIRALEAVGARVFPDIHQALEAAFQAD